jgi:hypothetical protein
MARLLRIEFPGALYHVTSRGDGRERQLNGVYTQWFNRTYHRLGHVFQGRAISLARWIGRAILMSYAKVVLPIGRNDHRRYLGMNRYMSPVITVGIAHGKNTKARTKPLAR